MTPRDRAGFVAGLVRGAVERAVTEAAKAETARIVALIEQRAEEAKGKTWYYPEHQLRALAKEIQGNKL